MKKFLALIVSIITVFSFVACSGNKQDKPQDTSYTIGAVEGAPTLSLVNVADGGFTYTDDGKAVKTVISVAASAQTAMANLLNGTYDMAILPVNNAVTLYNNNEKHDFRLATVNVFGVLYMIGKNGIGEDMNNLKGKVVNCKGFAGTPGLVLKHLLEQNEILYEIGSEAISDDKVYINPISQSAEAKTEYIVIGEPEVTAMCAEQGKTVVLDFKKEWQKLHGNDSAFTQAGLVVNVSKVDNKYLTALVNHLQNNKRYLYDNMGEIPAKLRTMGSTGPVSQLTYTQAILDRCNIDCLTATSQKSNIEAFLTANNVALPGESFYCA